MSTDAVRGGREMVLTEALDRERDGVEAALVRCVEMLARQLRGPEAGASAGGEWAEGVEVDGKVGADVSAPGGAFPIVSALEYGVLGGGKRVRPILCAAAFRAAGGDPEAPIHDLAVSLELIHAYSLMHDDLPCMDDADLRRGRPSTHAVHGEAEAVVAGAALIPAAALQAWRGALALGLTHARCAEIVRLLLDGAGGRGMVGGQALDLLGEERELDVEEVEALHGMKTGALLAAAPAMGGVAAGADGGVVEALRTYGEELGLAFQIADDVLDATSTAETLGKEPSDAALSKSTYVSRFGVEGARQRARERVERAVGALGEAGIDSPLLRGLAEYVIRRRA